MSSLRITARLPYRLCFSQFNRPTEGQSCCTHVYPLVQNVFCNGKRKTLIFLQKDTKSDFDFSSQWWEVWKAQLWVLFQHHASQFATKVKETVWKLEQQIKLSHHDLYVCREAVMSCWAKKKGLTTFSWEDLKKKKNEVMVLHLLSPFVLC